jgi:hypothetical protein
MTDLGPKRLADYLKYKLECSWFATFYTFIINNKKTKSFSVQQETSNCGRNRAGTN